MRTRREGDTIRKIRAQIGSGRLTSEFTPAQVNAAPGITWAGTFLPKHRVGNLGNNTELFLRLRKGLYRLRSMT